MRRTVQVAATDFRDRLRSRRLLIVAIAIVYLGYVVNTGQAELVFQADSPEPPGYTSYYGKRTASYIGLSAGVVGAFVLFFAGFYLAQGRLQYDHTTNVDELLATTPISDAGYLIGKWLSAVGYLTVLLVVLWGATLVNHAIYGVGATRPLHILWPILVLGVPVAGVVAGIAVLSETTRRLSGTLGNVGYFFLALFFLAGTATFGEVVPSNLSLMAKLTDLTGRFAVYEVTYDSISALNPEYRGSGLGIGSRRSGADTTALFTVSAVSFPAWVLISRLGFLLFGGGLAAAGMFLHSRWRSEESTTGLGFLSRITDYFNRADEEVPTEDIEPEEVSLTPVSDRSNTGLVSLYWLELREVLRGHRWWWYLGSVAIIGTGILGLTGSTVPREPLLALALVWPVFIWSGLGSRPNRHQTIGLILSAPNVYRQLVAVWLAGVTITAGFIVPTYWATAPSHGLIAGLVLVSVIVFIPSFALGAGVWTRTGRVFEAIYLPLWYLALNGVGWADFAGFRTAQINSGSPFVYGAIGVLALGAALYRRSRTASSPLI